MKQIISIIVFALLIGVANAQTQQLTKQQLFPIYAPTMEMRSDTTAMKLLSDFNQNTVKLRAEYDERERSMSDLDFAEEVRRMKREFDMQSSIMAASVDASMKQVIKQRELDALKAQGPNRKIQGGTQNAMNDHYGVDPSVLPDDELQAQQKEDLKTVHDDIYKKDIALGSKRIDRDIKKEEEVMEMSDSQIERENSSQSTEDTYQSGEAVTQSENKIDENANNLVANVANDPDVLKTSGYETSKHKAGKYVKKSWMVKIQEKRQEKKRIRDERRADKKFNNNQNKIIKKNQVLFDKNGEVVTTTTQPTQQQNSSCNSQQDCQQEPCYPQQPQYYDNRTTIEKQYGLSGLGGFPANQSRIMSSGRR